MIRNPNRLRLALAATLLLVVVAALAVVALAFWSTSSRPSALGSPGLSASPSPLASLGFVPSAAPTSGATTIVPTNAPTSGATTLVAINQLATQVPSAVPSGTPITVAIYVTVVPGADLVGGSLSFAFIPDGSTSEIASATAGGPAGPSFDPSARIAQSFWVSFLVPSSTVGGTFVARLPVGTEVFRQHSVWVSAAPS